MFIAIALISLFLYAGLVCYIGWSGWYWLRPKAVSRRFLIPYIFLLAVVSSSFIIGRFTENVILNVIGAYWMAVFYLLIFLMPLAQITVWLLRFMLQLPHRRMHMWAGLATLLLLIGLLGYGTVQAYSPVVRSYDIQIAKPVSFVPSLKIAVASDTHFGLLSGRDHAARLVTEIEALKPDLVLLPGDIFDDDSKPYLDQGIGELLSQIKATYGVYASLGNHDKHDGAMEELIEVLEKSNIRVLYDEAVTIENELTLIGRKDRSDPNRLPLAALMEEADPGKPVFLLEHQPYDLDVADELGVDLMVSGHTHRGQIFPGNLLTKAMYENHWGHLKKGNLHSIVTSGFGFWGPPIRIGSRSEIVEINVTFGT